MMHTITAPGLDIILSQVTQSRKHENTPSARARLTPPPPPRKAPLPPEPFPHVQVIDQLLIFYDAEKVRGQVCSFNITTLATLLAVPYQAALDVVLVFHHFDLCKFDYPPHGIIFIKPEHREAFSFLEEEDFRPIAHLMGQAAEGRAPWQEGGGA